MKNVDDYWAQEQYKHDDGPLETNDNVYLLIADGEIVASSSDYQEIISQAEPGDFIGTTTEEHFYGKSEEYKIQKADLEPFKPET